MDNVNKIIGPALVGKVRCQIDAGFLIEVSSEGANLEFYHLHRPSMPVRVYSE